MVIVENVYMGFFFIFRYVYKVSIDRCVVLYFMFYRKNFSYFLSGFMFEMKRKVFFLKDVKVDWK